MPIDEKIEKELPLSVDNHSAISASNLPNRRKQQNRRQLAAGSGFGDI